MKGLLTIQRFFVRKLKSIPRQQWVQRPSDAYVPFAQRQLEVDVKYFKDLKRSSKQQKQQQVQLKPSSPKMGPYVVSNLNISNKKYRWCTCGQSLKQPFCDGSHEGTGFKPYKFSIEQNIKQLKLCGCKLTKKKPFCDGESCKCGIQSKEKQ